MVIVVIVSDYILSAPLWKEAPCSKICNHLSERCPETREGFDFKGHQTVNSWLMLYGKFGY